MNTEQLAATEDATDKKSRYYTLFILVLIYASSHIDRQIVAILAESIKQDLNLSDSQLGFLIGLSFALFYATLGIPIAILADRYSRRNIIAASVIIWSFMTKYHRCIRNNLVIHDSLMWLSCKLHSISACTYRCWYR